MAAYSYNDNQFVIKDFDKAKTFSSFLPGIAGIKGIPIWSFYTNRGQGLASFGVENKDNPILEFFPANTTNQYVHTYGFRSFVKVNDVYYEPFSPYNIKDDISRNMYISFNEFTVEEVNESKGIKYKVTYFVIPNENFGALARIVDVENITDSDINIEVLDGQMTILPYGITNSTYKEMSNLMRSWMEVYNMENNVPFYKMRASTSDSSQVSQILRGNFYLSSDESGNIIKPVVDANVLFAYETSLSLPINFINQGLDYLKDQKQITANKVPCGFTPVKRNIGCKESLIINTIIGQVEDIDIININADKLSRSDYLPSKRKEANDLLNELLNKVETKTSNTLFDSYIKQCYLDNLLRGGHPIKIGSSAEAKVYYLYSRKHGDIERDYNFFNLSPEYYSQGNGNYRDVNQNRRNDILINPEIDRINLKLFYNLIQLDGYNPLEVRGVTFSVEEERLDYILEKYVSEKKVSQDIKMFLNDEFTLGKIIGYLEKYKVKLNNTEDKFIEELLKISTQNIKARFAEGFWSDHFIYNQDLLENYLKIYPDKRREVLFEDRDYCYYESPAYVLPRKDKYVLNNNGEVRQYDAVAHSENRLEKMGIDIDGTSWIRGNYGKGEKYRTSLFEKLLLLVLAKFMNLDPSGIGIEMEADKPGWNDAMNGLPGLIGSGVGETAELQRVVMFLSQQVEDFGDVQIDILKDIVKLSHNINTQLNNNLSDFDYWDDMNCIKEAYRETIKYGILGDTTNVKVFYFKELISRIYDKLESGISKAINLGNGIVPTFLYHDAIDYNLIKNNDGTIKISSSGLRNVEVKQFQLRVLPCFLEGPAKVLKIIDNSQLKNKIYKKVKASNIYDKKLQMYKTSESIESLSNEIGRARAFTPGWQERESVFLHMTYKYLLGLLKSKQYETFYQELKTNLICFKSPDIYGRSPIENSSFIASSENPDSSIHGQGFVARLSGSTAELLSIWDIMMTGHDTFTYVNETLCLKLMPILPKWLFDSNNSVTFKFLGSIDVTYIIDTPCNTYENVDIKKYVVDGVEICESIIAGELAYKIRNQDVKVIQVYLERGRLC